MFSSRVPADLTRNRLADALSRARDAGRSIVDLTQSNPTAAGFEYPCDLLAALGRPAGLSYRPDPLGLRSAREAVADDFARRGLGVSPGRIVLTPGTSDAYSYIFKLACDPGDEVLVPRPSYPLFDHLTRLDGVTPVPYDVEHEGRWAIDPTALEDRITGRTRAVLVVSPNNPTGGLLSGGELSHLAEVCARRSLVLVGDEVFADYPLGTTPARSVLEQDRALAFSLGGLSKSAGLPQVKLGWMAAGGPESLVSSAIARIEVIADAYLSVATPAQEAAAALIAAGARIRAQIHERLRANLAALRIATAARPSARLLDPDAGWYAVVRVPSTASEEDLVVDLLEQENVLVHPGYFFDFPSEAFVVISLLTPPADFQRGTDRMLARLAS